MFCPFVMPLLDCQDFNWSKNLLSNFWLRLPVLLLIIIGWIWWIKFFSNRMHAELEQMDVTLRIVPLEGFSPTKWVSSLMYHKMFCPFVMPLLDCQDFNWSKKLVSNFWSRLPVLLLIIIGWIWWIKFFSNRMQELEQMDVTLRIVPLEGFSPTKWVFSLLK